MRIEKISLNDGPGMRTVIFLKGCPLRCAWCSTPESQQFEPEVYYVKKKCVGCGKCVKACKQQALTFNSESKTVVRNRTRCVNCFDCVAVCPTCAQGCYGKDMTVSQVMQHVHRDEVFYFHSQGGVTLSGGDILCQPEFTQAILQECQDSGIHTMAEMDMYGNYDRIGMLLPYLDAFFVDIKHMNGVEHEKWTGKKNDSILANIRRASKECIKDAIHVRVPVIWGVNDSEENIRETIEFCRELSNCAELEFLPYHRLGRSTYDYLDREYQLPALPTMTGKEIRDKLAFLKGMDLPFPVHFASNGTETE